MTDLLQAGLAHLSAQRKAHASHSVTYRRGASTVNVDATVGKTEHESLDGYGRLELITSRDFLITAADLIIDAALIEPEERDQIDEVIGTTTYTYEVLAPTGDQHFRYSDPNHVTLRVHTKLVDTVTA